MPWGEPAYRMWLTGDGVRETEQSVRGMGLPALVAQFLHACWFVLAVAVGAVMVLFDPSDSVWIRLLVDVLAVCMSVGVANSLFGYIPERRLGRWSRSRVADLLWLAAVAVHAAIYWFVVIPR